ncbi:ribonuclease H-like domain-containing protein [Tanacetum coccineum]
MAFVSSPSSTNEVNTAYGVSTNNTQVSPTSTQVSIASTQVSTANLSDTTVYAFLASQPNGSHLVHEDLEQIHVDDLEEMILNWKLALLSMRTRRFFYKTGRKITINRSDTAGYVKSKVKCFNCHKLGHFARECRGARNQDNMNKNQDISRRTINMEETSSKSMVAIDGAGFDWSYMADDKVLRNMALMAFSNSEVYNDKTCPNTYLKSFETLKTQLDDLRIEFNKSEFNLATYKRGLASVEEQLVFYKKNKVIFCEQLAVLKRDISYKDSEISMLKSELEKLKQEKESNQLKIEKFDNASKSVDKLIGRLISLPKLDLSNSGLEKFQQPEFKGYGPKTSKSVSKDISNKIRESPDAPLVEELVSDDKLEKKTGFPTVAKINFVRPQQQEKLVRKPVKYAEMYRSQTPKKIQRNWNNQKSQQLGSDFVIYNKASFVCGSFDHVNIVPRAVLMKTGLRPLNTARPGHSQKEDQGYINSGCSRHNDSNNSKPLILRKNLWRISLHWGRFTWVFFLASKDETSGILKSFITQIENLVDKKVKIIRCDNGTEFKNKVTSDFCEKKGIKREFKPNGDALRKCILEGPYTPTTVVVLAVPTTENSLAVPEQTIVETVLNMSPANIAHFELKKGSDSLDIDWNWR